MARAEMSDGQAHNPGRIDTQGSLLELLGTLGVVEDRITQARTQVIL